jgi:hypothetical protein
MKIKNFDMFLDGGTIMFKTNEGTYSIDDRIDTTTRKKLYLGYPKDDNSNIVIDDPDKIYNNIMIALKEYKNDFYQVVIDNLLEQHEENEMDSKD